MLSVAHVLIRIPARVNLLKSRQRVRRAIWQVREQLRRPRRDLLRGASRQLGRLARFLLDDDIAAYPFPLHLGVVLDCV